MKNIRFILYFGVLVACFSNPLFLEVLLLPIPTLKAAMGFFLHEPPLKRGCAFPTGPSETSMGNSLGALENNKS